MDIVAVSKVPELLLSRPSCCACGFAGPCVGVNDDLSFPSGESLFCEASSPLSEDVSYPFVATSDVGHLLTRGGGGDGGFGIA